MKTGISSSKAGGGSFMTLVGVVLAIMATIWIVQTAQSGNLDAFEWLKSLFNR